jgi:hypothetical protein
MGTQRIMLLLRRPDVITLPEAVIPRQPQVGDRRASLSA